jgi:hypothetical protein
MFVLPRTTTAPVLYEIKLFHLNKDPSKFIKWAEIGLVVKQKEVSSILG